MIATFLCVLLGFSFLETPFPSRHGAHPKKSNEDLFFLALWRILLLDASMKREIRDLFRGMRAGLWNNAMSSEEQLQEGDIFPEEMTWRLTD